MIDTYKELSGMAVKDVDKQVPDMPHNEDLQELIEIWEKTIYNLSVEELKETKQFALWFIEKSKGECVIIKQ